MSLASLSSILSTTQSPTGSASLRVRLTTATLFHGGFTPLHSEAGSGVEWSLLASGEDEVPCPRLPCSSTLNLKCLSHWIAHWNVPPAAPRLWTSKLSFGYGFPDLDCLRVADRGASTATRESRQCAFLLGLQQGHSVRDGSQSDVSNRRTSDGLRYSVSVMG
jgi:hypothetical protein